MDADLQYLEDRITALAQLCQQLRTENVALRETVVALKSDNRRLLDKVEGAKARVETLLGQFPAEALPEDVE
ncbi:hypothetical protein FNU76_11495 [Chitinimonas arctica]|uniref:DUF904 domain-containing protein n=1 Tax=Chitinimonas arctica TaxID=2594795 RepID=A0A516SFJ5_9NEIS|nr:hypothetical protein [Chitinimonas arctica]QDQ26936.1 hypothetical protein FNU76_11495 [Chitinimonas arctica]